MKSCSIQKEYGTGWNSSRRILKEYGTGRISSCSIQKEYVAERQWSYTVKGGGAAEGGADDWGEVVTR